MIPDTLPGQTMETLNDINSISNDKEECTGVFDHNCDLKNSSPSSISSNEGIAALTNIITAGKAISKDAFLNNMQEETNFVCDGETEPPSNGKVDLVVNDDYNEERELSSDDEDDDKLIIIEPTDVKKDEIEGDGIGDYSKCINKVKRETKKENPIKHLLNPSSTLSDGSSSSKKPRLVEDLVSIEGLSSIPQVEGAIAENAKDLKALQVLLLQKEEEWNALVRLQKQKEKLHMRLKRKYNLILMRVGEQSRDSHGDRCDIAKKSSEGNLHNSLIFLPQGGYSDLGASQMPFMMLNQMLSGNTEQVITRQDGSSKNASLKTDSHDNISIIDIHTMANKKSSEQSQITISADTQNKISQQLTSMKSILPKQLSLCEKWQTPGLGVLPGFGPQGPTVNVHQLIAAHRKDNPDIPPLRGAKRGAWRNRFDYELKQPLLTDNERISSVSSSNSEIEQRLCNSIPEINLLDNLQLRNSVCSQGNSTLPINDPSVSYKDVLLQFAQLTQAEKRPGSPQISIIPVNNSNLESNSQKFEPTPDSTSVSREHSINTNLSKQSTEDSPSSALAKLLLESSGRTAHGKTTGVDFSTCSTTPQYLTLSALLSSGGTTQVVKEKSTSTLKNVANPEGNSSQASNKLSGENATTKPSISGNLPQSNPKCQGCDKYKAQFVCAGCGNQWYCSRECQVAAWEDHSEHCQN